MLGTDVLCIHSSILGKYSLFEYGKADHVSRHYALALVLLIFVTIAAPYGFAVSD